jgi:hypothetical protein
MTTMELMIFTAKFTNDDIPVQVVKPGSKTSDTITRKSFRARVFTTTRFHTANAVLATLSALTSPLQVLTEVVRVIEN